MSIVQANYSPPSIFKMQFGSISCNVLYIYICLIRRNFKCDGINKIRRLAGCHPEVFSGGSLHPVTLALQKEVKNLRTQVARLAIVGLGDLFSSLKKAMDQVSLLSYLNV